MKKINFDGKKNVVGDAIKYARKNCRMSQQEVVAQMQVLGANIDQQMLSRIERCDRIVTDYELALIAKVLKVTPEELLSGFFKTL